jgi:hypothetical protein
MQKQHLWPCFALLVMIALAAGSIDSSGTESGSESTSFEKINAWIMTQNFVEDQLKSPSTASYGGLFSGDYQDPNSVVTDLGGGKYRVRAWVDSQNSFGGQMRTHFTCELVDQGGDSWRCTSLTFDQ